MTSVNNRYGKNKRLTANKDITALFLTGKAFFVFPYRVVFNIKPINSADTALQMAPSVSKKKFKRAVKRNYLKRITRESYRINCSNLNNHCIINNCQLQFILNYAHTEVVEYAVVTMAIQKIITQLTDFVSAANIK
jgi:ribonuclease P protein component